MKRIIINVKCVDPEVDDIATVFTTHISAELTERIKELSSCVKQSKAYKIVAFDYSGIWSKSDLASNDEIEQAIKDRELVTVLAELDTDCIRVDCDTLNVSEREFWWSTVPKHMDDSVALNTQRVPIKILDDAKPLHINMND